MLAALFTWDIHKAELPIKYEGKTLTLGGDARCDSLGFSAKFGSYILMDLETEKVVDFQKISSGEYYFMSLKMICLYMVKVKN